MNFKTPFKVLTTAALIGTLSLSAVAPGAASAAEKTVTAQAETPANFAIEKVVLVKGDSKISVSFDTYIDALGNEKALNGYKLAYVVAANGEVFALDTYVDFYEAGNTEKEVVEKLSKAGKTSEVTEVKDGAFNDGKLEPVEDTAATVKVESVSAINDNAVTVEIAAADKDYPEAEVVVKNGKDEVVPTKTALIAEGDTSAEFLFVTPLKEADKVGVWTVNGKEFSFDAINQLADILEAAADGNQINFQKALDAAGITYADELKIGQYLTAVTDGVADPEVAVDTLADVQKLVKAVDDAAQDAVADAAKVKAVIDAKTQAQLLTALQSNFDAVNPAWIVGYSETEEVIDGTELLAIDKDTMGASAIKVADIQNAIYAVNKAAIETADTAAASSADQAKVTALIEKWMVADDKETPDDTPKADAIAKSKVDEAAFRIGEAKTATTLYNALVAYANATPDATLKTSDLDVANKAFYETKLNALKDGAGFKVKADATNIKTAIVVPGNEAAVADAKTKVLKSLNEVTEKTSATDVVSLLTQYKALDKETVTADVKSDYAEAYKEEVLTTYTQADSVVAIDAAAVQTLVAKVNTAEDADARLAAVNSASTASEMSKALIALEAANGKTNFTNLSSTAKLEVAEIVLAKRNAIEAAGDAKAKEFANKEDALNAILNTTPEPDTGAIVERKAFLDAVNAKKTIATVQAVLAGEDSLLPEFKTLGAAAQVEKAEAVLNALNALKDDGKEGFSTVTAIKNIVEK